MKSNLKIEKITYRVNEEKKTVVCILDCDMQLDKHPAFDNHIFPRQWSRRMPRVEWCGVFSTSAIARCNADDVFDLETGKRIAESRAKKKAFSIAWRVYAEILRDLVEASKLIQSSIAACAFAEKTEDEHIDKLIG